MRDDVNHPGDVPSSGIAALAGAHGGRIDHHDGHDRWWITDPDPDAERDAAAAGLTVSRRLYQVRRPLPLDEADVADVIPTRAFDPARDTDAWLAINNAAFDWHPEQGHWTAATLASKMAEPWFDVDGFRIAEIDGEMAAFCWTKVHDDHDPRLGEIYVVAVDPRRRGTGLGSAMTVAGLDWLWRERSTPIGMLYVEHDNHAALAVYSRLEFDIHSTDVAFEPADSHLPFGAP
jgi:mycothiol synthase